MQRLSLWDSAEHGGTSGLTSASAWVGDGASFLHTGSSPDSKTFDQAGL